MYFKSGLGNLIQATPAMQVMAKSDPGGKIDVCMDAGWKHDSRIKSVEEILTRCEFVEKVIRHPGHPLGSYRLALVPAQCETSKTGRLILKKMRTALWPSENWPKTGAHEADVNMRLARAVTGYKGPMPPKYMPVSMDGPDLRAERKPLIGLCNGAFGTAMWRKKHWPYFKVIARQLSLYFKGTVIGIGSSGELKDVGLDVDFTGKLSITKSARVVQQLDLLVTTDTAVMHMGDALGVRMLVLFGPTLMTKNAPRNPAARMMRSKIGCAPCQYTARFFTCDTFTCMEQLTPMAVMAAVRGMMRGWERTSARAA